MNLFSRAKDVLLTPTSAWPAIAREETDAMTLYRQYIAPLATIPALAGFIGMSLIGVGAFGVAIRVPIVTGLVQMVVGYVMSLAMVYVVALIANALAPNFGGEKHPLNALKLAAYGSTAALVGGIFAVIPALSILSLVAALYSLFLLFLGSPALMRVPSEKALPYTMVLAVCAIILGAIAGVFLGAIYRVPSSIGALGAGGVMDVPAARITIDTAGGAVTADTARIEAWSKRLEAIGEKLDKAQQSGDQLAIDQAFKEMAEAQKAQPSAK